MLRDLTLRVYNLQPAPCIQCVIDLKLMVEIFQIVWEAQTITRGYGFESAPDGIGIDVFGNIRGMHDLCQAYQTSVFQIVCQENRLKRAAALMMAELHARRIEWNGAGFFCNFINLALRNK